MHSYSSLTTFESCPKHYQFRYVDRIKPPEGKATVEQFVGSLVHDVLEKLYRDLLLTKLDSLEELLDFFEKQWRKRWSEEITIAKEGLEEKHYFDYGRKCVSSYYERFKPFNQSKTLACERRININLDGNVLIGLIDRLAEENGVYEIHDYKTSSYLPEDEHFEMDRQLALYQIGLQQAFKDAKNVELVWHYLAFDKEVRSKRTEEDLRELKQNLLSVIREIELAGEKRFPRKTLQAL